MVHPAGVASAAPPRSSAIDIRRKLEDPRTFTPRWVDRLLDVLPWLLLGALLVYLAVLVTANVRWHEIWPALITPTGLLAAAAAAFLLRMLDARFRESLERVWTRQLLAPKPRGRDLDAQFAAYLTDVQRSLNRRLNWLWSVFFVLMMNAAVNGDILDFWRIPWIRYGWPALLFLAVELGAAFVLGFFAGRIIAVAQAVQRLGTRFELDINVQHPDSSGGLRPLGEVCLTNALILLAPAVHLGIWTVLLSEPGLRSANTGLRNVYAIMLVLLVALATLAFVRPLFAVHRAMEGSAHRLRSQLDAVSVQIDRLAREQLGEAGAVDVERIGELGGRLELLQKTYDQNHDIPSWPFDGAILGKFITSLFLPIAGLLTSLGFRIWS